MGEWVIYWCTLRSSVLSVQFSIKHDLPLIATPACTITSLDYPDADRGGIRGNDGTTALEHVTRSDFERFQSSFETQHSACQLRF